MMNTLIWLGIVLIAWCRPIDIYWRVSRKVNGRVVYQRDYAKWIVASVAVLLIVLGMLS